jgi:hypothetical protein
MNPNTIQLINTILAGAILLIVAGLAKWITGKADKTDLNELKLAVESKADRVDLNRVESESKASAGKLEVTLNAALLVVAQSITRPELAEKLTASAGRADDKTQRIIADIVQLNTDAKANAKANAETDKRLDDLPGRVRTLEENQRKQ